MNTMAKAHEIRRAAAVKWNCKVSEIHFGECLRMAHKSEETGMEKICEVKTTTGKTLVAKLGETENHLELSVPELGYNWSGLVIKEVSPAQRKMGLAALAGRIGLTADMINSLKDELGFTPWEVPEFDNNLVEVFVGDRHVLMSKIEAAEYRGF